MKGKASVGLKLEYSLSDRLLESKHKERTLLLGALVYSGVKVLTQPIYKASIILLLITANLLKMEDDSVILLLNMLSFFSEKKMYHFSRYICI